MGHAMTTTGLEGNKTSTSQKNLFVILPEIEAAYYPYITLYYPVLLV